MLAGGAGVALTTASAVAVNEQRRNPGGESPQGFSHHVCHPHFFGTLQSCKARAAATSHQVRSRRDSRIILHPSLMRPLAVLLGIVMGSAVSIAAGLILTWVVFLFLSDSAARFAPERLPLARGVAVFTLISAASAASFYGELRVRRWRFASHLAVVALLGLAVWLYWP